MDTVLMLVFYVVVNGGGLMYGMSDHASLEDCTATAKVMLSHDLKDNKIDKIFCVEKFERNDFIMLDKKSWSKEELERLTLPR